MKYTRALLLALLALLAACSDSDLEPASDTWRVVPADGSEEVMLPMPAAYGSVDFTVEGLEAGTAVLVSCDADWLKLRTAELPSDGIMAYTVATNDTEARRTARLTFRATGTALPPIEVSVVQRSAADTDTNGADARDCLYLGFGYDLYQAADDPMAVRTTAPVLDYTKLVSLSGQATYETVHDSRLSRLDTYYHTAQSLSEYSQTLSASQSNTDFPIEGCKRNCDKAVECHETGEITQQNFGYGSTVKAVAARVIDLGALQNLKETGKLPLTQEFRTACIRLADKHGEERSRAIEQLLTTYGTHIVVGTTLGGRIDYTFTMQQQSSADYEKEMHEEIDYTMGRLAADDRSPDYAHAVTSSKRLDGAIHVVGGSPAERRRLQDDIAQLENTSALPPEHIIAWLASIGYEERPAYSENLDVVHLELYPIWNLVADNLRADFINATLRLTERSDCQMEKRLLGTDLYTIDLDRLGLTAFADNDPQASLCRLLYLKTGKEHTPVLEVCSEYVPHIRTDARVLVAYPVYDGRIRMTQGIFLGDGIHQPAYVGFSGADCYVNPIDSLPAGSTVGRLCYINGNLRLSMGLDLYDAQTLDPKVTDDFLRLRTVDDDVLHLHPIVKIGSQFWTRHDIDHEMRFTFYPDDTNDDDICDEMHDGVLFTRFQADASYWFDWANSWTYGYAPLEFVEGRPNRKWYLPSPEAVSHLYAFAGFNPKSLFVGQASGFEAGFNGYYGRVDIENDNSFFPSGASRAHAQGRLNVICSKNSDSYEDACLMLLDDSYRLRCITDREAGEEWRYNYYPVRLTRGAFYDYHSLEAIDENSR